MAAMMVHWVGRDDPVLDRVAEDAAEESEGALHSGTLIATPVQLGRPLLTSLLWIFPKAWWPNRAPMCVATR